MSQFDECRVLVEPTYMTSSMKKQLRVLILVFALFLIVAWALASPVQKIKPGDVVGPVKLINIHDKEVDIPAPQTKWTHLQFRRFAACPICNLHLQSFIKRDGEITAKGIREVVVFHSPKESLLPYQGKFPFDVIGDPEKKLYAQFGVGTSIFSILDVRAWPAIVKGNSASDKPKGSPEGGPFGLPADFLIASDGRVVASHYGRYADDDWSVDELLTLAQ
jgi:peroxiredoxin